MSRMTNMELTFTGLCVLVIKADQERPAEPEDVEVLLVDASNPDREEEGLHVHRPLLSFRARDYVDGPLASTEDDGSSKKVPISVSPSGEEIISLPLTGKRVRIGSPNKKIEDSTEDKFSMEWAQAVDETSPFTAMDWVPNINRFGIGSIRTDQERIPPGSTSRILLPFGRFEARRVVMQETAREKRQEWDFKDGRGSQYVADHIVLVAAHPATGRVRIEIDDEVHYLVQPLRDDVLPLSITNLPTMTQLAEESAGNETPAVPSRHGLEDHDLQHLRWYGEMSSQLGIGIDSVTLPDPVAATRTRSSGICPGTRYWIPI